MAEKNKIQSMEELLAAVKKDRLQVERVLKKNEALLSVARNPGLYQAEIKLYEARYASAVREKLEATDELQEARKDLRQAEDRVQEKGYRLDLADDLFIQTEGDLLGQLSITRPNAEKRMGEIREEAFLMKREELEKRVTEGEALVESAKKAPESVTPVGKSLQGKIAAERIALQRLERLEEVLQSKPVSLENALKVRENIGQELKKAGERPAEQKKPAPENPEKKPDAPQR